MDKKYDHENSEVLVCKLRKANSSTSNISGGSGVGVGGGGGGGDGGGAGAGNDSRGTVAGERAATDTVDGTAEGGGQQGSGGGLEIGVGLDSAAAGAKASASVGASAGAGVGVSRPGECPPEESRGKTTGERPNAGNVADGLSLAGVTLAASPQGDVRRR